MKFTVQRDTLECELQVLQGIAEKRKTIPILSHILISADSGKLSLVTTDLEVSLTTQCDASISVPGGTTVSSKKLFEVVRSLPAGEIEMTSEAGEWLEISAGDAYFRLVSLPTTDFPEVPASNFEAAAEIPHVLFREMIRRTLFAVTKEDVRYSLNGALLEIGGGKVRMVATDAHRLAMVEQDDADLGTQTQVRAIIPKKALAEIRDLGEPESMLFSQDEHHLHFKIEHRILSTRVIEGQFPAYEKVVPRDNPATVRFASDAMSEALRRVSLLASERSRAVKFTFTPGTATIVSSNPEMGEARELVPVQYDGEELTVSFNAQYILDFLAVAASEEIEAYLRDDSSQGLMSPVPLEDGLSYQYVIMPMRL
ncbi:MAG TPA: DNA polymerase III subunit beta [Acidobacteriota bacterium]|nr:DNA polymerase III subunit beta [Acidobacteriota bacterium]